MTNQPTNNSTTSEPGKAGGYSLDLFSTSPTVESDQEEKPKYAKCYKNAPAIAIPPADGHAGKLYQGCCNDWHCPRCGELRARYEYGRIVEGSRKIQATTPNLYMLTLTCRGDEELEASEANFGANTAQFWDALRIKAKRAGITLAYCAITERQQRGHPHIHAIVNYVPPDTIGIVDDYEEYKKQVYNLRQFIPENMWFTPERLRDENNTVLVDFRQRFSHWIAVQSVKSGLGVQARIAIVDTVEGASRYIAKYLFKTLKDEKFPKNWKRVRYSQSWPKLEKPEATSAFVVLSRWDWWMVADYNQEFSTNSYEMYKKAQRFLAQNVVYRPESGE